MNRAAAVAFFLLVSVLSWWKFPGHTWLEQDTQIYAPILEHLHDNSVLGSDIIVERPHVAYTIYDEMALSLRWIARADFQTVLEGEDIVFRALGLWGVFLVATSLELDWAAAGLVTVIWSMGATISGPAVLTVEYEPVPRGFAVPLVMLAIGLAAHGRPVWSAVAAAFALLLHAPTTYPYWLVVIVWGSGTLGLRRRTLLPFAAALCFLLVAAHFQPGVREPQQFFARLTPALEQLQRMRASYNWISMWWRDLAGQYLILFAVSMAAVWRLWRHMPAGLKPFAIGLPAIGILSMPVSWLLLDFGKWSLMPQLQPMRALLFVTGLAVLFSAAAGCIAARERRFIEAFAWFIVPWLVPMRGKLLSVPPTPQIVTCLALALASTVVMYWPRLKLAPLMLAAYAIIPAWAGVRNYPAPHSTEIHTLSEWARVSTPKTAVFLFAGNGKENSPGIFRAEALRAVYVDWKGGGQVNYLKDFAEEWWSRWQQSTAIPFDPLHPERYRALGIDYLVVHPKDALPGRTPVYRNPKYLVFTLE